MQSVLGIDPGGCTEDKRFSLETVRCLGACGLAPVMCINGEFHAKISATKALKLLDACRQNAKS
ncbi:MAG: NAD(P)H-dependent oxidoreductase subunit E [bacterium]